MEKRVGARDNAGPTSGVAYVDGAMVMDGLTMEALARPGCQLVLVIGAEWYGGGRDSG